MDDLKDLKVTEFQFTHPGRGATSTVDTPRGGVSCFNSRTPGGVRRCHLSFCFGSEKFQFTHPGRGATAIRKHGGVDRRFQFTHPGRGATHDKRMQHLMDSFNSRTPGGVRHRRYAYPR